MFRIKICGITSVEDARVVADSGADAVGLNFYCKSPRCISPQMAEDIIRCLPSAVVKVGLFVNSAVQEVIDRFDSLRLDLIQLHGDEPPDFLRQLAPRPILRAFRVSDSGLAPILEYLDRCHQLQCVPELCLLDSHQAGQYGGTGRTADWSTVKEYPCESWHPRLVLAGGLTPDNVAAAIQAVGPWAVDTASGVESAPGRKNLEAVRAFVLAARAAFETGA